MLPDDPTNILLHFVALVWTLLGNFGLLTALDKHLNQAFPSTAALSLRPLCQSTAICWAVTLLLSPAPTVCSALSVLAISGAYLAAPHITAAGLECGAICAFVLTLVVASALLERKTYRTKGFLRDVAHTIGMLGLALGVRLAAGYYWHGALVKGEETNMLISATGLVMVILACLPKPVVPCVLAGIFLVRTVGEVTARQELLFFGAAFMAQFSQGISHDVTRQKATLLSHEASDEGREKKLAFEWSHVVYFPNLLIHSAYDTLTNAGLETIRTTSD